MYIPQASYQPIAGNFAPSLLKCENHAQQIRLTEMRSHPLYHRSVQLQLTSNICSHLHRYWIHPTHYMDLSRQWPSHHYDMVAHQQISLQHRPRVGVVGNTSLKYCNSNSNTWRKKYCNTDCNTIFKVSIGILLQYFAQYSTICFSQINLDFCRCVQLFQTFGLTANYVVLWSNPEFKQ